LTLLKLTVILFALEGKIMYKIEKKPWGYKLTFGNVVSTEEMKKWVEDSKKTLMTAPSKFGNVIDMRTLKPLSPEAKAVMEEGQKLYKAKGMERSAVILSSAVLTLQFKRIAQESGIYQWERYIDAGKDPNPEKTAEEWVVNGKDPDKK